MRVVVTQTPENSGKIPNKLPQVISDVWERDPVGEPTGQLSGPSAKHLFCNVVGAAVCRILKLQTQWT